MFKRMVGLGLTTALCVLTGPAYAANCAARDTVVERLKSKYSESFIAGGLQQSRGQSAMMEVWSSPETGTFTVLVTTPAGISCILTHGTDFFQAGGAAEHGPVLAAGEPGEPEQRESGLQSHASLLVCWLLTP